jgi:hypothetical protein
MEQIMGLFKNLAAQGIKPSGRSGGFIGRAMNSGHTKSVKNVVFGMFNAIHH